MKLRLFIFALFFLASACNKKNEFFFETNINDIRKSCDELTSEIHYLNTSALKKINRSQRNQKIRNTTLIFIAIPTVFTSLLFLDFSDDREIKEQEIRNRIKSLQNLQELKTCNLDS